MAINVVMLNGNIGKDLEIKQSQNGTSILRFSLAVKSNRKDENGEYKTNWVSVLAFNKTAELIAQYCGKGSKISIRGSLECGSYQKDGVTIYTTDVIAQEVEFLSTKQQQPGQAQPQQQYQQPMQQQFQQQQQFTQQPQYQQMSTTHLTPMNQQQGQQFAQQMGAQVVDSNELPF